METPQPRNLEELVTETEKVVERLVDKQDRLAAVVANMGELILKQTTEIRALRRVYEMARSVAREDGVNPRRYETAVTRLECAIDIVKLLDAGQLDSEVCPDHRPELIHTGDGTPVEYCPNCGKNEVVGSATWPETDDGTQEA